MSVNFDEDYYKKLSVKKVACYFSDWVNYGLFSFKLPNHRCLKIKNYTHNFEYLLKLITGGELPRKFNPYDADEELSFVIKILKNTVFFDVEHYLSTNEDVRKTGVDPYYHYAVQGYKENRSTGYFFDPVSYLEWNADVKLSGVNPVYHYVTNGIKEARKSSSLISNFIPIASSKINKTTPEFISDEVSDIGRLLSAYDYIFLTHDNVKFRTGGIQKIVQSEVAQLNMNYLLLSPTSIKNIFMVFDSVSNTQGYISVERLRQEVKILDKLVIHSFVNTNLSIFESSNLPKISKKIIYWIHDYSSICKNFLLLRNNYENCGAPPLNSLACSVCGYSDGRSDYVGEYEKFFKTYLHKIKFVAPSLHAKKVFNNYYNEKKFEVNVREHFIVEGKSYSRTKIIDESNPLKIGYVGSTQPHKGFGIFLQLIASMKDVNFYVFSSQNIQSSHFTYVHCSTQSLISTSDLLEGLDIDILILPSRWEETFCIVAYEALKAGCTVYVMNGSGNLEELSSVNDDVFIFKTVDLMRSQIMEIKDAKVKNKNYYHVYDNTALGY
jgi:glycosyltransferase involved in cell wall biosynthesis